jgi:hypothetical protein
LTPVASLLARERPVALMGHARNVFATGQPALTPRWRRSEASGGCIR